MLYWINFWKRFLPEFGSVLKHQFIIFGYRAKYSPQFFIFIKFIFLVRVFFVSQTINWISFQHAYWHSKKITQRPSLFVMRLRAKSSCTRHAHALKLTKATRHMACVLLWWWVAAGAQFTCFFATFPRARMYVVVMSPRAHHIWNAHVQVVAYINKMCAFACKTMRATYACETSLTDEVRARAIKRKMEIYAQLFSSDWFTAPPCTSNMFRGKIANNQNSIVAFARGTRLMNKTFYIARARWCRRESAATTFFNAIFILYCVYKMLYCSNVWMILN